MPDTINGILRRYNNQFSIKTFDRFFGSGPGEVNVPQDLIRRFGLIEGAAVTGQVERNKGPARLVSIESIGGNAAGEFPKSSSFCGFDCC